MNVYFTVDTESSIGGALAHPDLWALPASQHIFCRIGDEEYGIPLLVHTLSQYGFRGTFFVETLATRCLGEADTASVFDFLLRSNQDVQLHIHPAFWFLSELQKARNTGAPYALPGQPDLIGHFEKPRQLELLSEAVYFFKMFAGYRPLAFRAGCFAGSRSMLQCLNQLGIRVDSSFNPCYHPDISFPDAELEPNLVQRMEGVWELPVTVAQTPLPEGHQGFKFADCSSLSFAEIRAMLNAAAAARQEHFVMVFHSFSAVKTKDYRFKEMRPNRIVIRRLQKLFQYLSQNSGTFRVNTFGDLAAGDGGIGSPSQAPLVPQLPLAHSTMRKAVQLLNNAYWF
jgi:hypothetical protein